MSLTLGAAFAATYRSLSLRDGPLSLNGATEWPASSRRMTWFGDHLAERGELPFRRERALMFLDRGASNEAYELLLGAVACLDAPDRAYRACLEALQRVCAESGRTRALARVDWYLEARWSEDAPFSSTHAVDVANGLAANGDHLLAGRIFEREGFPARAALAHERGGDSSSARALWGQVARELANDGGPVATVHRSVAVFCAARNSAAGAPRMRAVQSAIDAVHRTLPALDATGDRERVLGGLALMTTMACNEGVPYEVVAGLGHLPELPQAPSVEPWVDEIVASSHGHDVTELCGRLLVEPPARFAGLSTQGKDFVRRRLLLARLLAVEVGRPTRCPEDDRRFRRNLALRLGQLGDRRFQKPLERMLDDEDAFVRRQAADALREIASTPMALAG